MKRRPVLFYAMCGEGMGHATRSWPVIRYLSERYEVHVFAGGRVHEYLVSRVEHLHWFQTLVLIYRNNQVDVAASTRTNFSRFFHFLWSCAKFIYLVLALRPHVLVTDFEAVSAYMSIALRLKSVSFDNQHIFTRTAVRYPPHFERDAKALRRAIFWTIPYANRYVISTFYHPAVTRPHTRVVPPIVRPEVLALMPSVSDTVLVYQTSASNDRLVPTLNQTSGTFVVYGMGRDEVIGNCTLRTFSEVRFLDDLARARAVITNGGHTLLTEALALGKPLLCEPVVGQFEQILNALYVERMGFGRYVERMTAESLEKFLGDVDRYRAAIAENYPAPDNGIALRALEDAVLDLSPALREWALTQSVIQPKQLAVKPLLVAHHLLGRERQQIDRDGAGRGAAGPVEPLRHQPG